MGLLVALLLVGPPQSSKNGHSLVKVACVVTGADLALTEGILARGGREYNPVLSNRAVRISAGSLGCAGLLVLSVKNPDKARKVAVVTIIVRGLVMAWNVKELTKPH
jgi:hypothetical protein